MLSKQKLSILFFICAGIYGVPLEALSQSSVQDESQSTRSIKKILIVSSNKLLNQKIEDQLNIFKNQEWKEETRLSIREKIEQSLLSNKNRNSSIGSYKIIDKKLNSISISYRIKKPYSYQFFFKGNSIDRNTLYRKLRLETLSSSSNYIHDVATNLKKYYLSLAYNNVQVSFEMKTSKFHKKVTLHIKEGEPFVIKKLSIQGSLHKDSRIYKDLFSSFSSSALYKGYFVQEDFDNALNKMATHFRELGYYQAKVYEKDIQFRGRNVFIKITLHEGTPITIGDIHVRGHKILSKERILKFIQIKDGDMLNIDILKRNLEKLIREYHKIGFLNAKIRNIERLIQIKSPSKPATIHIDINEGQPVIIGDLQVKGNKEISSSYIAHASLLKKGSILNAKALRQAYNSLENLSLFSSIQIKPDSSIQVKEHKFRFFRVATGIETENQLSGKWNLEFDNKNFLNIDGSHILINVDIQTNALLLKYLLNNTVSSPWHFFENDASIVYTKHYVFNSYFDLQTSYSHSHNIFSFKPKPHISFIQRSSDIDSIEWVRSQKLNINMERRFSPQTTLNLKLWDLEFRRSSIISQSDLSFSEDTLVIPSVGASVTVDKRDNVFIPKSGYKWNASIQYTPPVTDLDFIQLNVEQTWYLPLFSKKWTYAMFLGGGLAYKFGSVGIPVSRLTLLGGLQSIRGYDGQINGRRIPSQIELPISNSNEVIPSSSYYLLTKQEIRFPLVSIFSGAVFYDGGFVAFPSLNLSYDQTYRHAAGLSLYIELPLGSLVFHLAHRLQFQEPDKFGIDLSYSMGAF